MTRPLRLWPVLVPTREEELATAAGVTTPDELPVVEPSPDAADGADDLAAGASPATVVAVPALASSDPAADAATAALMAAVIGLAGDTAVAPPGDEGSGEGGVVVPLRRPRPRRSVGEPAPLPTPIRPALRLAPARYDAIAPFRRRQTPPARRRRRTLLLLGRRFFAAVLVVALPVAAGAWLLGVPRLRLRDVEVAGTQRVDPAWVTSALGPWSGQNILLVPLDAARAAILRHPWVAAAELRKELPDRLQVRVRERVPVALLEQAGRVLYLDAGGRPIAPYDAARGPDGLTVVRARAGMPPPFDGALAVAAELAAVDPAWSEGLTALEVLGDEDFLVRTRALPFPILVRRGHIAARASALVALLPELVRRYPALDAVDLRFERRIVVQPITQVPGAETAAAPEGAPAPSTNDSAALSRRG